MAQMTLCIDHVAQNAKQAAGTATQAKELSHEGSKIVQAATQEVALIAQAVERSSAIVRTLGQRSADISGILKAIKDIADQTNLLALNAAIEAARAGEQGRGFSVVADEVRRLAERTAEATGEIARTVEAIQNDTQKAVAQMEEVHSLVQTGCSMVEQAAGSLQAIRSGADDTVLVVRDIADAAMSQSSVSVKIAGDVQRIADIAEQGAVATQVTTKGIDHLIQLAGDLERTASGFTIEKP
jgi:methyl-accepting chemotaxis protein